MHIRKTSIQGLIEILPDIYHDNRGWFVESYNKKTLQEIYDFKHDFVQDNLSYSGAGVLRGLHFQNMPFGQGKLVKVIDGEVLDVAVDLRPDSPTFGRHEKVILSGERQNMFYIPEGFAHGFLAIKNSFLFYKCTRNYHKPADTGIMYNDPILGIDWKHPNPIVSEKDQNLQSFSAYSASLGL